MTLFVLCMLGCNAGTETDSTFSEDEGGHSDSRVSPSTLYVNAFIAEDTYDGAWNTSSFDDIPVSVYRKDAVIATGATGEPLIVTTGDVEVEVGPSVYMTDTDHPYFSDEQSWTADGYPLVVEDYFRLIHVPVPSTVEGATEIYNAPLAPIVGEAQYDCWWEVSEIDDTAKDGVGAKLYEAWYGNGLVRLVDGTRVMADDVTNFSNLFADGDVLRIDDYTLVLDSTNVDKGGRPVNSLRDVVREGAGYTDFSFTYRNVLAETSADVMCTMRWDAWESTFPDPVE